MSGRVPIAEEELRPQLEPLLAFLWSDPARVFTCAEVSEALGVDPNTANRLVYLLPGYGHPFEQLNEPGPGKARVGAGRYRLLRPPPKGLPAPGNLAARPWRKGAREELLPGVEGAARVLALGLLWTGRFDDMTTAAFRGLCDRLAEAVAGR